MWSPVNLFIKSLAKLVSNAFYIHRLDPSNARAKEGIERVEKQGDMGAENTFDVEVEEMENSENEVSLSCDLVTMETGCN